MCYCLFFLFFYTSYIISTSLFAQLAASLLRGKTPPSGCPGYDTKQSDGEVPVMLGLWGMGSPPSLPLLPGPLWLGMVAHDRALSMGQIELNCELNCLN